MDTLMTPDSFELMFQITDDFIHISDSLKIPFIIFKFAHTLHLFSFYFVLRSGRLILEAGVLLETTGFGCCFALVLVDA